MIIFFDMNKLLKTLLLFVTLALCTSASAQRTEYIVKEVKGSVEYKLKATDDWQPAKRLLSLPKSSILKLADGASITVYTRENPQALRISTAGEHKLRTLITEAEKKATESRGNALTHILNSQNSAGQTVRSGTSYRGAADVSMLASLSEAVKSPLQAGNAPISLRLIKDEEGDYDLELSNNSSDALALAVIVKVNDKYNALNIAGDGSGILILPEGKSAVVPECKLVGIEGMRVIAIASEEEFSPETLCILLNSPAETKPDHNDATAALAVEVAIE